MYKLNSNYLCISVLYFFSALTKMTSMSGGSVNGCWVCQSEQGPPLF